MEPVDATSGRSALGRLLQGRGPRALGVDDRGVGRMPLRAGARSSPASSSSASTTSRASSPRASLILREAGGRAKGRTAA